MPGLTNRQKAQVIRHYYGINPKTFQVECVSETRGGRLSVWRNGQLMTHGLGGKDGRSECAIAFDLSDIEMVVVLAGATSEHEKSIITQLKTKAAKMKKEANKGKKNKKVD
jgi:hypothetical protein